MNVLRRAWRPGGGTLFVPSPVVVKGMSGTAEAHFSPLCQVTDTLPRKDGCSIDRESSVESFHAIGIEGEINEDE